MSQDGQKKVARGTRRRWREARIDVRIFESERALRAAVKIMGQGTSTLTSEGRENLEILQTHVSRLIELHRKAAGLSQEEDNDRRLRQVFRKTAGVAQVRKLVGK